MNGSETLCPALADALRKMAEKRPDKFSITHDCADDLDYMFVGDIEFPMERLYDADHFTLDHMDAIAGAVGMEFEVLRFSNQAWYFCIRSGAAILEVSSATYPDKRTASLAALLAIINHVLEEK